MQNGSYQRKKKLLWHLTGTNAICFFKMLALSGTQFEGERPHGVQTLFAETLQTLLLCKQFQRALVLKKI